MSRLTTRGSFRIMIFGFFLTGLLASCNVARKYTKEASEKWEKDIVKFEQLDKTEKYPDDAILFTGSSSIRMWSTIKEDVAPYPVIQRGFGGSKFSDLAFYIKRIVYPHQFRALVIFEANDITGSATDKTPEEVVKLFRNLVGQVRNKYHDQPIFVIEITPVQSRWAVWPQVSKLNQQLKQACDNMKNTYFIETAPAYLDKDGKPRNELFIKDLLHQNRAGYVLWGELIRNKLDEVLHDSTKQ